MGLGWEARKRAKDFFKGKDATDEEIDLKASEIARELAEEHREEQRKRLEGNAVCPKRSFIDILLRRNPSRPHSFRVFAYID
jgi:hypothetical protein